MRREFAYDPDLLAAFRATARAARLDPADRWVDGYVDYEWQHLRKVIGAYGIDLQGAAAFELGCNIGASSVVMARLGARVEAIDIVADLTRVAQANFALHGVADRARARHVADSRTLPFADASFDFALANSVLEYIPPQQRQAVIEELHRLLRPGGQLLICGTSNRLAPREVHSGKWLVNYLPRGWFDSRGNEPERGIAPWRLVGMLGKRFEIVGERRWLAARTAIHGEAGVGMRAVDRLAGLCRIAPGLLSPNIELLVRKR